MLYCNRKSALLRFDWTDSESKRPEKKVIPEVNLNIKKSFQLNLPVPGYPTNIVNMLSGCLCVVMLT